MPPTSKNNAPDEKTTKINEKGKRRSSEEYTKINKNDINIKQEENFVKTPKKIIQIIYYLNLINVKKSIQWKRKENSNINLQKLEI